MDRPFVWAVEQDKDGVWLQLLESPRGRVTLQARLDVREARQLRDQLNELLGLPRWPTKRGAPPSRLKAPPE